MSFFKKKKIETEQDFLGNTSGIKNNTGIVYYPEPLEPGDQNSSGWNKVLTYAESLKADVWGHDPDVIKLEVKEERYNGWRQS